MTTYDEFRYEAIISGELFARPWPHDVVVVGATGASLGATFREAKDRPIGGLVLRRHRRTWSIDRSGVESDT